MSYRILVGDVLEQLCTLPDESVHCVVTSPPYWGLRDYGTATWEGGDPECDHTAVRRGHGEHEKQATSAGTSRDRIEGGNCRKCGAVRQDLQIGLEQSLDEWCARLVDVFREVRRVLRKDGVFFLNVGDGYTSGDRATYQSGASQNKGHHVQNDQARPRTPADLKPKDLIGQPWLLAFALRADGWYLRADCIWHKPNTMPESVRDRPTKAHEYVFVLTKSARYFWDQEAVREPHAYPEKQHPAGRNLRSVWTLATEPYSEAHFATFPTSLARCCILAGTSAKGVCAGCGAPWVRVMEEVVSWRDNACTAEQSYGPGSGNRRIRSPSGGHSKSTYRAAGWRPSCSCDAGEPVPATVLDPFAGSGTVALTAEKLGRDSINIDLSPSYADMMRRRIENGKITKSFREFLEERKHMTKHPIDLIEKMTPRIKRGIKLYAQRNRELAELKEALAQ